VFAKSHRRSLDDCAFQVEFPEDVLHRGIRFQVQSRVMVLYGLGPFGVYLCRNDDCGQPMLIGQGINFTDTEGFKNLMPLMHESFRERVRRNGTEQDEGQLVSSFHSTAAKP
jgi:hypothetical protein